MKELLPSVGGLLAAVALRTLGGGGGIRGLVVMSLPSEVFDSS